MIRPELTQLVGKDETVLWTGVPNRKAFLWRSAFNLLLPIAIIWSCFDIPLIVSQIREFRAGEDPIGWFLIPFFLLHMLPIWTYLVLLFTSFVRYKNTGYVITNKSVYTSGGVFALNTQVKPLAKLSTITIERGFIDKKMNVGSVVLNDNTTANATRASGYGANSQVLMYLEDYEKVFELIRDTQAQYTPFFNE